jgi:hypothetical protein
MRDLSTSMSDYERILNNASQKMISATVLATCSFCKESNSLDTMYYKLEALQEKDFATLDQYLITDLT